MTSPPLPRELKILKYIHPRMNLSGTQQSSFHRLRKGYEGEQIFINMLEKSLATNYLIINDCLLKINNTEFQVDTLLIGQNTIYLLEIKNFEGDFYIQNSNWYSASYNTEIRNPLHQLKRSELLLQEFLRRQGFKFSIESYIIFINPEFYLYEAPLGIPTIFPTQINRFIKKLNSISFHQSVLHKDLAKALKKYNLSRSAFERLPKYKYENLNKGIVCKSCSHYLKTFNYMELICNECNSLENTEVAVKRSIIEFTTLFPNKKITTNIIHEWCRVIKSKKTIRRILKKHLSPVGTGRHTYYIFNQ